MQLLYVPIIQDLEEVDPPKQFNRSTYFTVAGERRQTEIPMPSSLLGSKPGEVLNRHVSGLHASVLILSTNHQAPW